MHTHRTLADEFLWLKTAMVNSDATLSCYIDVNSMLERLGGHEEAKRGEIRSSDCS